MPTLAEMTAGLAPIAVSFNAVTVHARYRPAAVTERVISQISALAILPADQILQGFADLNRLVVELVADWDLTENDGVTMYPLEESRLAELPILFRVKLLMEAINDIRPQE